MAEIAVLLGSNSDLKFWEDSKSYLDYFGIEADLHILSAHRTPEQVAEFARKAPAAGYKILIAGAGMAAHLAGALAAHSILPVLGVPLPGGVLDGMDALLATVQMPAGVPVATFAIGSAGMRNACIFAVQILSLQDRLLQDKLTSFKAQGARLP